MTKDLVAQRIHALAKERGGHVSLNTFLVETGIKDKWLRTQPWFDGWNNLLQELGLVTKSFEVPRSQPEAVARAVAALIARDGKWPTEDELARERRRDAEFPSLKVIRPLRKSGALAALIVEAAATDPTLAPAGAIASAKVTVEPTPELGSTSERVRGYVYLLRSGRRYKIGKSNDPSRRWREVRLELPDETHQVHTIPTDDPSGIETYWHQRFAAKRVRNTEFFELDAADVQAFKRRSYQ
jgi:hypothetical protein